MNLEESKKFSRIELNSEEFRATEFIQDATNLSKSKENFKEENSSESKRIRRIDENLVVFFNKI